MQIQLRAFVPSVSSDNLVLALTRGRADMVKLLDKSSRDATKKSLKTAYGSTIIGKGPFKGPSGVNIVVH